MDFIFYVIIGHIPLLTVNSEKGKNFIYWLLRVSLCFCAMTRLRMVSLSQPVLLFCGQSIFESPAPFKFIQVMRLEARAQLTSLITPARARPQLL